MASISDMKKFAKSSGIGEYLETPYHLSRVFYWYLRRTFNQPSIVTRSVNGVAVDFIVEYPEETVVHELASEKPQLQDLLQHIRSDDVFLDVGANIGLYTCFVGKTTSTGNVIAIEPSPVPRSQLEKNIALNEISAEIVSEVLSDTSQVIQFAVDRDDKIGRQSTIVTDSIDDYTETTDIVRINSRTGPEILQSHDLPTPTVVKVDVEGAELHVIRGLVELLDDVRLLYCEVHNHKITDFDHSRDELFSELESADFSITTIHERNNVEFIRCEK